MLQLIEVVGNVEIAKTLKVTGDVLLGQKIKIEGNVHLAGKIGQIYPVYQGDYIVTPYAHRQTSLATDDKLMEDDVLVLEIPYVETSNQYGTTVAIATE